MSAFKNFELEAIRLMGGHLFTPGQFEFLTHVDEPTSYEYTGSGYYLKLSHPSFPKERKTLCEPAVIGIADEVRAGFVLYVGENTLTLECHTWGAVEVPSDFRDRDVQISTSAVSASVPNAT